MLQPNPLPCNSPWPSEMSRNIMTIMFLQNFLRAKFVKTTYIPTQPYFTH